MSRENKLMWQLARQGFSTVFQKNWPMGLSGILMAVLAIITFTWARPWGVVGGLRNAADWFFYGIGLYSQAPPPFHLFSSSLLTLGLLWGSLAGALMAGEFAFRVPPRLELIKGLVGGALLGLGSALAGGCNVGGFYSALSALSASGLAMMAGLLAGAYLGLKYLYWEMEHFEVTGSAPAAIKEGQGGPDWQKTQPWLGAVLMIAAFVVSELYANQGYVFLGGLLLCGLGFGFIMNRSRFCFARCFREPFMTGDAEITKAVIVSLAIAMLGFATLKWVGLRPEGVYVTPNFGLGALLGGVIFGFGMLVTGGCGSGTAWRAMEGQVKLIVALVMFALTNSLVRAGMDTSETIHSLIGIRVFMPDYLGYQATLVGVGLLLLAWYLLAVYNEETDRFVVEM